LRLRKIARPHCDSPMINLKALALFISLTVFLSILFYFLPRAMNRMHAKYPKNADRWTKIWWSSIGSFGESEALIALLSLALLFASGAVLMGLWPN
jgi:hypothetical protein